MKRFDLKSMGIGVGIGASAMLALGAATAMPDAASSKGRYQLDVGSDHGLVLDTATGQVWSARLSGTSRTDKDFIKTKAVLTE
jgi:hypothetical protein